MNNDTTITTYDESIIRDAIAQLDARRTRLGFGPRSIAGHQKSIADGKGDRYYIRYVDNEVVDVSYEFDASF